MNGDSFAIEVTNHEGDVLSARSGQLVTGDIEIIRPR